MLGMRRGQKWWLRTFSWWTYCTARFGAYSKLKEPSQQWRHKYVWSICRLEYVTGYSMGP
jgi:hypothetical protein